MQARLWLKGLLAAAIGGGANAIGVALSGTEHVYTFEELFRMSAIGAVLAVVMYLKKSPLPDIPERSI